VIVVSSQDLHRRSNLRGVMAWDNPAGDAASLSRHRRVQEKGDGSRSAAVDSLGR
jgi:hypothetical protein